MSPLNNGTGALLTGGSPYPTAGRIAMAALLPALVCLVQWHFWWALAPYAWFLFYPTVFMAVLLGRLWGGILATLTSAALVWMVFIEPGITAASTTLSSGLSLVVFIVCGIILSLSQEFRYRRDRRHARLAGEARFRQLFEQAMDGIIITDAAGQFIEANSRFCLLSGYPRDDLLELPISTLLPEDDLGRIRALAVATGSAWTPVSEWTLRARDGVLIPVEVSVCRFPDGCWSAIVRDIRDRRRAERQERAAEARFHAFMDTIPAVAWIKDAAGNHIYLNQAWAASFGVRREDWIGKPAAALMPAPLAARLAANDAAVLATGAPVEAVEETRDREGRTHLWRSIKFPVNTPGNPTLIGGVAIEITEQRRAADTLEASAELNRAVLDSVRSQMAVLDRSGRIIAVNEAWRRFAQEHSETAEQERRTGVGTSFLEACRTPEATVVHQAVVELLQGRRERFTCDCPCDTPARQLWFHMHVTPLPISAGGAVVSYFDITEIKRSQELQVAAAAQLKAMAAKHLAIQEEERRLLSLELHDHFGQSLTCLQLRLHALYAELKDHDRSRMTISETIASVEELVTASRNIARRLRPPALDDLGLASAVRWHVAQIAESSPMALELQQNLDERRLAPTLELACFRVVQEAMSNALRHSGASRLSIALCLEADGLRLSIKDNGVGFDVDATFRKLQHLASLGLIGMRERVADLGGRFQIISSPGKGTEIAAYFPFPPDGHDLVQVH